METVKKENENFVLNRLVYDSNYIDFIKELSRFENCGSIVSVLDSLTYYRQTSEVFFQKPEEEDIQKDKQNKGDHKKEEVQFEERMEVEEERKPLLQEEEPKEVTSQ